MALTDTRDGQLRAVREKVRGRLEIGDVRGAFVQLIESMDAYEQTRAMHDARELAVMLRVGGGLSSADEFETFMREHLR